MALVDVDHNGYVIARTLTLALVAIDDGMIHALSKGFRTEDEVDAHPLVFWKPELLIIPVGVALWH